MNLVRPEHTLSIGSVNLILFTAQQRGADSDALCRAIDLDPARLRDPDGRLSIRQVQELWRQAISATGDPHLALHMGQAVNPVSVGILAYVMMHCPTLGQAFDKLCQYQDIVCDAVRTTGLRVGDEFLLQLQVASPDLIFPENALNSEVSIYLSAIQALTGRPAALRAIRFGYPHPVGIREHERVFAPAVLSFDADMTTLVLDAASLHTPVLNANPNLFPLFEQHADALLQRLRQPAEKASDRTASDLAASVLVKREIIQMLKGEEPTLTAIAGRLALGVRTLQLHLKSEGATYQQLLDDVRKDLAVSHLREPFLSTTDIAYLLGFAEPSVFFRSFKKWTGQTPGAFRQAAA